MPTYRRTRQADEDLKEIYRYTQRTWGRAQAGRYIRGLEQRFRALAANPPLGIERTVWIYQMSSWLRALVVRSCNWFSRFRSIFRRSMILLIDEAICTLECICSRVSSGETYYIWCRE